MRLARFAVVLAASVLSSFASAQQVVPVSVTTGNRCPIAMSGQMAVTHEQSDSYSSYTYEAELSLKNVSNRQVLMVVVSSVLNQGAAAEDWNLSADDLFFRSQLIEPGATHSHFASYMEAGSVHHEADEPLNARARVVFVEFADGTFWGDLSVSKEFIATRIDTRNHLYALRHTYRTRGEDAFVHDLLSTDQVPGLVAILQAIYNDTHDVKKTISQLNDMLGAAYAHRHAQSPHRSNAPKR